MGAQAVTNSGKKTFTAGEALAAYRLVKLNSSGNVVYADAGDDWIGSTLNAVANGDDVAVQLRGCGGSRTLTASAAISTIASLVYLQDDGKVSTTNTGRAVGRVTQAASGDASEIEVIDEPAVVGVCYASVASSSEVENTTAETAFSISKTIAGETLVAGDVLRIRAQFTVNDNNSTDTLNLKLKMGGVTIAATGAVDVADGDIGYIDALVTVRTAGASGFIVASGVQGLGVPGTVTAKPFLLGSSAIDLSGDVAITATGDWSVKHADNEVELTQLVVEIVRQAA
jgi:hypothetical protein